MSGEAEKPAEESYATLLDWIYPDGPSMRPVPSVWAHTWQLKPLARNLEEDLFRLGALGLLPIVCVGSADRRRSIHDLAQFKLTGTLYSDGKTPVPGMWEEIASIDRRSIGDVYDLHSPAALLGDMLDRTPRTDTLHVALEAHYAAIVLWTYTIVEALSVDLWKAALKASPKRLSRNVLDSVAQGGGKVALSMADVTALDFDVAPKMGDLLLKKELVSFGSMHDIEEAYKATFPDPSPDKPRDTKDLHDKIFEPHRETLRRLECVRNLIAHRAGKVDQEFVDKLRRNGLDTTGASLGERYPMRPREIAGFAIAATRYTRDLFAHVDNWLRCYSDASSK